MRFVLDLPTRLSIGNARAEAERKQTRALAMRNPLEIVRSDRTSRRLSPSHGVNFVRPRVSSLSWKDRGREPQRGGNEPGKAVLRSWKKPAKQMLAADSSGCDRVGLRLLYSCRFVRDSKSENQAQVVQQTVRDPLHEKTCMLPHSQ